MRFDLITLLPELFAPFLQSGVTRRAYESRQVDVRLWNPRDFADGNYRRIDDRPSIRTPMAITDAIREGKVMVFETWESYLERYPHLEHKAGPGNAIICVPFSPDGSSSGGFGITFTNSISQMPLSPKVLDMMATCCEVLINGSWAQAAFSPGAGHANPKSWADLNTRQKTIVQLVAEGNTNPEIAVKMRFSPSLIKKELQELYRIFGVSDRKALAALAPKPDAEPK